MATARIISRSQRCSRELARELVARGYAVEIVSPDAIPDNLADLELRVEATADQLTATVEARNGGHSASFAFVHRLKAPIADFVPRPPETSEKVCFPAEPVSFNAEPSAARNVAPPPENSRAPGPARKLEILPAPEAPKLEILADPEKSEPLITPPEQVLAPAKELAKRVRRGVTITLYRSNRKWKGSVSSQVWGRVASQGRARLQSSRNYCRNIVGFGRRGLLWAVDLVLRQPASSRHTGIASSAGWFGRAAMIFAAVVVVAIVLAWGISRGGVASIKDSQTEPGQTSAAPDLNGLTTPEPEHAAAALSVPTAAGKSEVKPAPTWKTPRVHTNSKKSRAPRSRATGDDLVAHDTVTYFSKPGSAAPARDSSRRRASSHRQSRGVASASTSPL